MTARAGEHVGIGQIGQRGLTSNRHPIRAANRALNHVAAKFSAEFFYQIV